MVFSSSLLNFGKLGTGAGVKQPDTWSVDTGVWIVGVDTGVWAVGVNTGVWTVGVNTGRYKSRTGSTRITSPGRINSDQLGSTRIDSDHRKIKNNKEMRLLPV